MSNNNNNNGSTFTPSYQELEDFFTVDGTPPATTYTTSTSNVTTPIDTTVGLCDWHENMFMAEHPISSIANNEEAIKQKLHQHAARSLPVMGFPSWPVCPNTGKTIDVHFVVAKTSIKSYLYCTECLDKKIERDLALLNIHLSDD